MSQDASRESLCDVVRQIRTPDLRSVPDETWHELVAVVRDIIESIHGRRIADERRDDTQQETLVAVLKQRNQFRGATDAEAYSWLRRIAAGVICDLIRRRTRHHLQILDDRAVLIEACSPIDQAIEKEDFATVQHALGELDTDDAMIVRLHVVGSSFVAIGRRFDISPDAARMRFNRAVGKLKVWTAGGVGGGGEKVTSLARWRQSQLPAENAASGT